MKKKRNEIFKKGVCDLAENPIEKLNEEIKKTLDENKVADMDEQSKLAFLISEEGCELVKKMSEATWSDLKMSYTLRLTQVDFQKIRNENQWFNDSIEMGRDNIVSNVESSLYESCYGFVKDVEYKDVRDYNGRTEERKTIRQQYVPPSVEAIKTVLYNLRRNKYKQKQDDSESGLPDVVVQVEFVDGNSEKSE